MSHLQESTSSSGNNDASASDCGLNMPDQQPPPGAGSGYPGSSMELYEMEGYVLQSLELLASTPTTQYYGPEIPQNEAIARSPLTTLPAPRYDRWDGRQSFQQVHQRVLGGQEQLERSCYNGSPSSSSQSPATLAPIYTNLGYHNNANLESASAVESNNPQDKAAEPTLKRQRNTAASARFRAKKKRNEQMQAQNAREREAIITRLENRVTELETENRWLKNLLIDKAEAASRKDSKPLADERKGYERKDGVGTLSLREIGALPNLAPTG